MLVMELDFLFHSRSVSTIRSRKPTTREFSGATAAQLGPRTDPSSGDAATVADDASVSAMLRLSSVAETDDFSSAGRKLVKNKSVAPKEI
jgi:hypothetical protein